MPSETINSDDLFRFKKELIAEIRKMLSEMTGKVSKEWLKSYEVGKMLKISPGTLQKLRNDKTIPYTKLGGAYYYEMADLQKYLMNHKVYPPTKT